MIHIHKNLHFSTPSSSTLTLRIDHDQATTQLKALGCSRGDTVAVHALLDLCTTDDTRHATQPTSAIGATTFLDKTGQPCTTRLFMEPTDPLKEGCPVLSENSLGATTDLLKSNTPSHPDYSSAPTDIPKQGVFDKSKVFAGEVL